MTSYLVPFVSVLHQNKALDNFHKRVRHPIARRIKGRDLGLQSYQTKSFCNKSLLSAKKNFELSKPCLTETKLTIFVAAKSFWYLCSFFFFFFQKVSIHISCPFTKPVQNRKILFFYSRKKYMQNIQRYINALKNHSYTQPVPSI